MTTHPLVQLITAVPSYADTPSDFSGRPVESAIRKAMCDAFEADAPLPEILMALSNCFIDATFHLGSLEDMLAAVDHHAERMRAGVRHLVEIYGP